MRSLCTVGDEIYRKEVLIWNNSFSRIQEAAMGPVRELAAITSGGGLAVIREQDLPPITVHHFEVALSAVTCSVSSDDLEKYFVWNKQYGSFRQLE